VLRIVQSIRQNVSRCGICSAHVRVPTCTLLNNVSVD